MEKKREPLRYRHVADRDSNSWSDIAGLDEMKYAGCYIVQLRHGPESNQLPLEPCDDEHYIVATLIVTESGTADMLQKNRMIGQTLIMPDCGDGCTRIFNRTLKSANKNSMWNSWNNIAQTGVDNEITSTEELVASVMELMSETENIKTRLALEMVRTQEAEAAITKDAILSGSFNVNLNTDSVTLAYRNIDGAETPEIAIPVATSNAAGMMSAEDKKKQITLFDKINNVHQSIGKEEQIVLKYSDLLPQAWNNITVVPSTGYNMWIVPLVVGRKYIVPDASYLLSLKVCGEYPSVGKTIDMSSVTRDKNHVFTATEETKYLVVHVKMGEYDNSEYVVTAETFGVYKELDNINGRADNITKNLDECTTILGSYGSEKEYTSSDFCGFINAAGNVVPSNSSYNGLLFKIVKGQTLTLSVFTGLSTIWIYRNMPFIGTTEIATQTYDTVITSQEDILYVLINVEVPNFTSVIIEHSPVGLVNDVGHLNVTVGHLNEIIGDDYRQIRYTTSDFSNLVYNPDTKTVTPASSVYNSLIIPIDGKFVTLPNVTGWVNCFGFTEKPYNGLVVDALRLSPNTPIDGTSDIKYVLLNIRVAEFNDFDLYVYPSGVFKRITNLENAVSTNPFANKTIVCFGDSITEFNDGTNRGYGDYLAEMTGAKVVRAGIGGTQLVTRKEPVEVIPETDDAYKYAYGAVDISNLAKAWANNDWGIVDNAVAWLAANKNDNNSAVIDRLKNCPIENTDIVIVFGGTNDLNNSTYGKPTDTDAVGSVCGGINQIIDSILTVKPDMVIYFFTPIPRMISGVWSDDYRVGQTEPDGSDLSFPGLVKRIKECVEHNHIPCCDMYYGAGITKKNINVYADDGVHPNHGYSLLANRMYGFIMSNRNWL